MQTWESIQHSVDFIEQHIAEMITTEELAASAHLSPFYYQRLFKKLVNKGVQEYIRLRRLANAASMLRDSKKKIIDAALDSGFENYETFTRAFKQTYGMTPEEYRRNPCVITHFQKPNLSLQYTMVDVNVPLISEDMILEVKYHKMGKPRFFQGIERDILISELMGERTGKSESALLWEDLHASKKAIPRLLPHGNEIGFLHVTGAKEGFCKYLAAAEVSQIEECERYTSFTLWPNTYLVCGFESESEEQLYGSAVFKADRFMERWIKEHKLQMSSFGMEMYYPDQKDVFYLEHWGEPLHGELEKSNWSQCYTKEVKPTMGAVSTYIAAPFFESFLCVLHKDYHVRLKLEYSCCSMQQGWNIKCRTKTKNLCTIYPEKGQFKVLCILPMHMKESIEKQIVLMSDKTRVRCQETPYSNGTKWLMVDVCSYSDVEDILKLVQLRYASFI